MIVTLEQTETVRLDRDRLGALYRQLGEDGAEDVVCRAIEELATRGLMFLDDDNLPLLPEWESQMRQLDAIRQADAPAAGGG